MNLSENDLESIRDALIQKRKSLRHDVATLLFSMPARAAAEADGQALIITSNGALGMAMMLDDQDDRLTDLIDRVEARQDELYAELSF